MKVGTDGVLLGAWVNVFETDRRILDIGGGSGIISLMIAQRSALFSIDSSLLPKIIAIDIDAPSAEEAHFNFENSKWNERLESRHTSLQDFILGDYKGVKHGHPLTAAFLSTHQPIVSRIIKHNHPLTAAGRACEPFDLLVSNPPYFINSQKAPNQRRSSARHTDTLSHEELISAASTLLDPEGRFAIILPTEEAEKFIDSALPSLHLNRLCKVSTTKNKSPKRYLMEFRLSPTSTLIPEEHLYIQEGNTFTEQYKSLTREFYLKF